MDAYSSSDKKSNKKKWMLNQKDKHILINALPQNTIIILHIYLEITGIHVYVVNGLTLANLH